MNTVWVRRCFNCQGHAVNAVVWPGSHPFWSSVTGSSLCPGPRKRRG